MLDFFLELRLLSQLPPFNSPSVAFFLWVRSVTITSRVFSVYLV